MKIKISEIAKITSFLLLKFIENQGDNIEITNDFYWDIPDDELYNPYKEPKKLTLGQLSDDMIEINRLSKSDDAIVYDLKRLSAIIKALSIENPTAF